MGHIKKKKKKKKEGKAHVHHRNVHRTHSSVLHRMSCG